MEGYPAVPLTVYYKMREEYYQGLIGHDLIIRRNGYNFFFIKEATLERLMDVIDETSFIIDLTDSKPFLEVNYIPKP